MSSGYFPFSPRMLSIQTKSVRRMASFTSEPARKQMRMFFTYAVVRICVIIYCTIIRAYLYNYEIMPVHACKDNRSQARIAWINTSLYLSVYNSKSRYNKSDTLWGR